MKRLKRSPNLANQPQQLKQKLMRIIYIISAITTIALYLNLAFGGLTEAEKYHCLQTTINKNICN